MAGLSSVGQSKGCAMQYIAKRIAARYVATGLTYFSSLPSEVDAGHFVEANIVWSVEAPQPLQQVRVNGRVSTSLTVTETTARRRPHGAPHARETLGRVEVKISPGDVRTQAEEALYGSHLAGRVEHQPLAADEVNSVAGEMPMPRGQIASVQAEAYRTPVRVYRRPIATERQALEAGEIRSLGRRLGVV